MGNSAAAHVQARPSRLTADEFRARVLSEAEQLQHYLPAKGQTTLNGSLVERFQATHRLLSMILELQEAGLDNNEVQEAMNHPDALRALVHGPESPLWYEFVERCVTRSYGF